MGGLITFYSVFRTKLSINNKKMGLEIITQPQLFLRPLTALNGIEGYAPPYIATFYTWMTSSPVSSYSFPLTGNIGLNTNTNSEGFVVNIDGVVQPPPSYTVDANTRRITFVNPIPADTDIFITQIGTIAFDDARYVNLTAVNLSAINFFNNNLSSDNIRVKELSAGKVTGDLNADTIFAKYVGINVQTATQRLEVSGNILLSNKSGLYFRDTTDTTRPMIQGWDDDFVYVSAPKDLIFRTENTTERARISADGTGLFYNDFVINGNLGVGITGRDPKSRLHITQGPNTQYPLIVEDSTNNTTPFVITSAGRVGIGTMSPTAKVHLYGNGTDTYITQESNNTSSPRLIQYLAPLVESTTWSGLVTHDPRNPYGKESHSHRIEFEKIQPFSPIVYWTAQNSAATTTFDLVGNSSVRLHNTAEVLSGAYVVTVGGIIQRPDSYTINPTTRQIEFTQSVPANNQVYVLQLINPALSGIYSYSQPVMSVSASPVATTTFRLTGLNFGLHPQTINEDNNYLVSVDGVYQVPTDPPYNITSTSGITAINFATAVQPNLPVTVTKIPSAVNNISTTIGGSICYLTPFYTWTSASPVSYTVFDLIEGPTDISTNKNCYLVNIGGVLQVPTSYSFDPRERKFYFVQAIAPNTNVSITLLSVPEFKPTYSTKFKVSDTCYKENTYTPSEVLELNPQGSTISSNLTAVKDLIIQGNVAVNDLIIQGNVTGKNISNNFYLGANRSALGVATTAAYFDISNALTLLPNKDYEIDYYLYYTTANSTNLRFVLSANNTFSFVQANHLTTQSGANGLLATGNAQTGGITGLTTSTINLPPFPITAGTTHYSEVKCFVETASNNTVFAIAVSGDRGNAGNGTVTPLRGSRRSVVLLN